MVSPPEYPGKVVRGVITDLFGNLAYLLVCIRQIIYGVGHPQSFDQFCKVMPRILLNQSTKVRFAVVEHFRQRGQSQCLVIMLDILQYE